VAEVPTLIPRKESEEGLEFLKLEILEKLGKNMSYTDFMES
jgi:hypothetical protein